MMEASSSQETRNETTGQEPHEHPTVAESESHEIEIGSRGSPLLRTLRVLVFVILGGGFIALLVWLTPLFLEEVVIPALDLVTRTFTRLQAALLIVGILSIAPTFLQDGFPALWLAGIIFGYGFGMLLATLGTTIGMSIPFLITRRSKMVQNNTKWFMDIPKVHTIVQGVALAGEWKSLTILRLGPIPYIMLNYVAAVVPSIEFWKHYLPASVLTRIPLNLAELQFGIVVKDVAEAYQGAPLSTIQIIGIVASTLASLITIFGGYYYAKRAWQEIQEELAEKTRQQYADDPIENEHIESMNP